MNKENVLFGIIGLLIGLIAGFLATNYINRNSQTLLATNASAVAPATATAPNAPFAAQGQPQVNNQVVRDQPQNVGRAASGAAMPQVQQTIDRAKNEPASFEAQLAAGEMYYRIQRFDEAAEYYEKAAKIKPGDFDLMVKTGNAYFDARKFEQAEAFYTQALTKNPNDVNVRTDLGVTFVERANPDLDRAITEFRRALAQNPSHEQTLHNLAIALSRKGDTAGLQETLAQLEKVDPTNPLIGKLRQQN